MVSGLGAWTAACAAGLIWTLKHNALRYAHGEGSPWTAAAFFGAVWAVGVTFRVLVLS